jgi:hypothetical protein
VFGTVGRDGDTVAWCLLACLSDRMTYEVAATLTSAGVFSLNSCEEDVTHISVSNNSYLCCVGCWDAGFLSFVKVVIVSNACWSCDYGCKERAGHLWRCL